jgi:plasmid stabilization system protein ParE
MAHRLAPQAEAELDEIWYYIARESHSVEIAGRAVDSITDRFSPCQGGGSEAQG